MRPGGGGRGSWRRGERDPGGCDDDGAGAVAAGRFPPARAARLLTAGARLRPPAAAATPRSSQPARRRAGEGRGGRSRPVPARRRGEPRRGGRSGGGRRSCGRAGRLPPRGPRSRAPACGKEREKGVGSDGPGAKGPPRPLPRAAGCGRFRPRVPARLGKCHKAASSPPGGAVTASETRPSRDRRWERWATSPNVGGCETSASSPAARRGREAAVPSPGGRAAAGPAGPRARKPQRSLPLKGGLQDRGGPAELKTTVLGPGKWSCLERSATRFSFPFFTYTNKIAEVWCLQYRPHFKHLGSFTVSLNTGQLVKLELENMVTIINSTNTGGHPRVIKSFLLTPRR